MKYLHLRHAAGSLSYSGITILLDPMLAPKGVTPPIANSWNDLPNPLVDLPVELSVIQSPEYCLVTHLHRDHFDDYALKFLAKDIKLICQTEDEASFAKMGFTNVIPIDKELTIGTININRVEGQHGTGQIAKAMGVSSGYVLRAVGEPTLYITGDTVFYDSVKASLDKYQPEIIIAFGGGAQFAEGDPITLTPQDILQIHQAVPQAKIICVHMEAINHCRTTREDLQKYLSAKLGNDEYQKSFIIPADGEPVII